MKERALSPAHLRQYNAVSLIINNIIENIPKTSANSIKRCVHC